MSRYHWFVLFATLAPFNAYWYVAGETHRLIQLTAALLAAFAAGFFLSEWHTKEYEKAIARRRAREVAGKASEWRILSTGVDVSTRVDTSRQCRPKQKQRKKHST